MSERNKEYDKVKHTYEGFDENSPRPPVPGEERAHCSSSHMPQMEIAQYRLSSPTPCRNYYSNESYDKMGYESESRCKSSASRDHRHGTSASYDNFSLPSCFRWASSLDQLLQDYDGVTLFRSYLDSEGYKEHADALLFWFACEGLRQNKQIEKVKQIVKKIYNVYFKKRAFDISEELRKRITKEVKRLISSSVLELPVTIFDEIQAEVEKMLSTTTYPNFLKSDIYLYHLRSVQNEGVCSDSSFSNSCSIIKEMPPYLAVSVGLPTLHEDKEFVPSHSAPVSYTPGTGSMSTGYHTPTVESSVRLTKNLLLATESQRLDVRPKPEAYADRFLIRGKNNYSVYNSYNPVTRQGSELQSLSSQSDARTESDMSLTDKSVDDRSLSRASHRKIMHAAEKQQAAVNKSGEDYHIIPRTQMRQDSKINFDDPSVMELISKKLEKLKREQDQGKDILKKLRGFDSMSSIDEMDKLRSTLDDDQCILDEHVQRVFSDGSPGFSSPCRPQFSKNRWHAESHRQRRKDKDGISLFSSDSGNVHDFYESSEHRMNMVKSKSMEDRDKFSRATSSRKSSRRTTDVTQFDSGISVVSDSLSVPHGTKDFGVMTCMKKSDMSYSEMSAKHARHRKASRSNSVERNSTMSNLEPAQPFVADPNMPPLPHPNTSIQLEEARRRLEDNVHKQKFTNKYVPDSARSGPSTLNKVSRSKPTSEECTSVIFSFWDEEFPYLIKIPGRQITLKQLKDNLPKKGNYRYFFKTECAELDNQVIQEEVRNDSEVVPLFEGKVMVQGKPVD